MNGGLPETSREKSLFKVTKTRLAAGAATVALAAGGIGVGIASAGASTTQCTTTTKPALQGSCGDLANAKTNSYGLAVKNGNGKLNAQIVGSSNLSSDSATDFYIHQTNGNSNERVMEFAPKAKRSGLCVSQTSRYANLTLRYCNGGASQEFYALGDTQNDTAGLQWINAATGQVIDINKGTVTMDELSSSSTDKDTYLHWVGP